MQLGIIGCGTVAQTMHIPHAVALPEVDLVALSDPAIDRVETLADRYGVPGRFRDAGAMIDAVGDLDAVVVLTPMQHHAEVVEVTLGAGVHTLVEKPLAVSLEDADRMVAAAEESDATAMVAYMKRYAPAYARAREVVPDLDVDLVTAYDVDPDHERILREAYDIVGGAPPEQLLEQSQEKRAEDAMNAVGSDDPALVADYNGHLEHVCHDVNLLRGLFGRVERIDHAALFADGRYATAHLRYEDDVRCVLTSGDSDRRWFEEFVRVDTPGGAVTLEYFNPFLPNRPATLRVRRGVEELSDETYRGSYEEPFKRELRRFLECARGEREVTTTFAQAREDVRLVADLFRHVAGEPRSGEYERPDT